MWCRDEATRQHAQQHDREERKMFVEVLKATGVSENVKQALTAKICGAGGSDFQPISDSRGNHLLQLEDQNQPKRKKRKKNKKSKSPEVASPD